MLVWCDSHMGFTGCGGGRFYAVMDGSDVVGLGKTTMWAEHNRLKSDRSHFLHNVRNL